MGEDKRLLSFPSGGNLLREATAASRTRIRTGVGEFSEPSSIPDNRTLILDSDNAKGPMAGVLRALELHPDGPVFVLAVDMPGVQQAAISYLCEQATVGVDRVVPWGSGRIEPLCGVYFPSALPILEAMVERGQFGLQHAPLRERLIPGERLTECGGLSSFGLRSLNQPSDLKEF